MNMSIKNLPSIASSADQDHFRVIQKVGFSQAFDLNKVEHGLEYIFPVSGVFSQVLELTRLKTLL